MGHIEVASPLDRQRAELLLFVRNPGWKRREMPMDVAVALLATEAQYVQALGRKNRGDCAAEAINEDLSRDIGVQPDVVDYVLEMFDGSDEGVPEQTRIPIQERDVMVIAGAGEG